MSFPIPGAGARPADRRLPPVSVVATVSMALVICGGIFLAAHLPHRPPLGPAIGFLAAGGATCLTAVGMLVRIRPFAWGRFFQVVRWALLAYLVITGLLELVFVKDGTRGATLAVLTSMLAVFAVDVPLVMAFTVARYEPVAPTRS